MSATFRHVPGSVTFQEELAKEAEVGAGRRGGLVLMGPALIPQELHFLVVYIFSAQDVLSFSAVGPPSINAVVQVQLNERRVGIERGDQLRQMVADTEALAGFARQVVVIVAPSRCCPILPEDCCSAVILFVLALPNGR